MRVTYRQIVLSVTVLHHCETYNGPWDDLFVYPNLTLSYRISRLANWLIVWKTTDDRLLVLFSLW